MISIYGLTGDENDIKFKELVVKVQANMKATLSEEVFNKEKEMYTRERVILKLDIVDVDVNK